MTPAYTCARSARPGSSGSSVPTGVALIGLGISLWRDQRKTAAITADGLVPAGAPS